MNKIERERSSEFLMKRFVEKDITQQYLSELSGVNAHSIHNYIYGKCFPNRDMVTELGKVLGFTFEEFSNYVFDYDWRNL